VGVNDYERTIAATLQAQAQEASMKTRTPDQHDALDVRLDRVDRSRRRWQVSGALVAAAAVIAIVAFLVGGRPALSGQPGGVGVSPTASPSPSSASPSVTPSRDATYRSAGFVTPFVVTLPEWARDGSVDPKVDTNHVTFNRCADNACLGFAFLKPTALPQAGTSTVLPGSMPAYKQYVAYLKSLATAGSAEISGLRTTTIDGRRATVLTVSPTVDLPKGVGCEKADGTSDDCWDFFADTPTHLAVIDQGATPLVVLMRTNGDTPDFLSWMSTFDAAVASLTLG
jgi:hypothetical protein